MLRRSGASSTGTIKPSGLVNTIRSASFRRSSQPNVNVDKSDSKESVEDLLRGLLDPSASSISSFRVLYNLEVIYI